MRKRYLICPELSECKICGYKAKMNNEFCIHLSHVHKIHINEYIKKFFPAPVCEICKENLVEMPKRPLFYYARNRKIL